MLRPPVLLAAVLALGAWSAPQISCGQPARGAAGAAGEVGSASTEQQLRAAEQAGQAAYARGDYGEAVVQFQRAERLRPTAEHQLELGTTYEQLQDASRALAAYREYLRRAPAAPNRSVVRARVAEHARRLAQSGVQQVSIRSTPSGANVVLDAQPVGASPLDLDLKPGPHRIEFRLAGYEPVALEFELASDKPMNVVTTLAPTRNRAADAPLAAAEAPEQPGVPAASADTVAAETAAAGALGGAPPVDPPAREATPDTRLRTIGFIALGASVAALGAALAFEVMRGQSEGEAEREHEQIRFARKWDEMESRQTWALIFAGAAGLFATAGGALLVIAANADDSPHSGDIGLSCGPGACQASYRKAF